MDPQPDPTDSNSITKPPVVRGARACTVCRAAKMKCVGAEDGQKQCQRCKRANVECVFEKHRRGRKPGSKLSEASKMLRRLEKGLNTAKLKSQTSESTMAAPYPPSDPRSGGPQGPKYSGMQQYGSPGVHFPSNELPPLNLPYSRAEGYASSHGSRSMDMDEDDEDADRQDGAIFPAKLIERQRNSFFRTILNPEETPASSSTTRSASFPPQPARTVASNNNNNLCDPIAAGIIDEEQAKVLFDLIFLRLNPFINLFDPALHSVAYVRSKCPFLFTTLIMAGCKFFKPELFKRCQKLAHEFAVQAFAEGWKRVEVVQAFACLTYWKDPDDNRTWTYIGYACRMAVELNLNRYLSRPPSHETEYQMLQRRNGERTYLVLFTHDRSLSTQTGRNYMLQEDDFVRHSDTWHEEGGTSIRPEDVIVAAQVQLRRIASETAEVFLTSRGSPSSSHNDFNYEVVLRNCNAKLSQWMDKWQGEMQRANGDSFHFSFLNFFRLYIRLFLNSFGIQASLAPSSRSSPSLQALSACCSSAMEALQILSKDFASMSMLRYGQDSITVMSAYCAVFLLRLLRSSSTLAQLNEGTQHDIHSIISKTADVYQDASMLSPASTSAAYHARFLRSLVTNDIFKARRNDKDRYDNLPIDPRLQGPSSSHGSIQSSSNQIYPPPPVQHQETSFHFPTSPRHSSTTNESEYSPDIPARSSVSGGSNYFVPAVPNHASELDAHYWRNMFLELGFGENMEQSSSGGSPPDDTPKMSHYGEGPQHRQQVHHHQNQLPYHHMHPSGPQSYGR